MNFVVNGKGVKWEELIEGLWSEDDPKGPIEALGMVDMERGLAASRPGLVGEIIRVMGGRGGRLEKPDDLVRLDEFFAGRKEVGYLVMKHFDWVATDERQREYGTDFFGTLRNLVMDQRKKGQRKLVLLIQSRVPLAELLPRDHPMSSMSVGTEMVELQGNNR